MRYVVEEMKEYFLGLLLIGQIRHLHQPLMQRSLRLIHSGRMLTDGVLLLPWLRSLEQRVRRQAAGMGGDVEEVLREVGLAEGDADGGEPSPTRGGAKEKGKGKGQPGSTGRRAEEEAKVFLHCTVGGVMGAEKPKEEGEGEEEVSRGRERRVPCLGWGAWTNVSSLQLQDGEGSMFCLMRVCRRRMCRRCGDSSMRVEGRMCLKVSAVETLVSY